MMFFLLKFTPVWALKTFLLVCQEA